VEAACKFLCLLVISPSEANRDGWISVRCCRQKCCKRPTCSIDSELSRDLWLPAHLSSLALCITYGGYWNLSVFNLFLHGTSCTRFCVLCALGLNDTITATMLLLCQLIRFIDNQGLHLLAGLVFRGSLSALPSSGLIGPPVPQQL
jgi:hypothetical protein